MPTPTTPGKFTRRRLVAGTAALVAGVLALTGCGGTAASSGDEGADASGTDTRTVVDATGTEVEVPSNPDTIVALGETELDSLLALGVTPAATSLGRGQNGPPRYLPDKKVQGIELVGSGFNPDYEKIAALQPDLIIAYAPGKVIKNLRKITSATVSTLGTDGWKDTLRLVAETIGETEQAKRILADYRARVDRVRKKLGKAAGAEISIVRWMADGPQFMGSRVTAYQVAKDLGFTFPEQQQATGDSGAHSDPLSLENLHLLDADWIFVGTLTSGGEAVAALQKGLATHAWKQLDAVRRGHATVVDGSLWTSRAGPIGVNMILDTFVDTMAA